MWGKNSHQPVGLRKLDSKSILRANKWPPGHQSQADAVLHKPDSTSLLISGAERVRGERRECVRERERWSGSVCPVAYKKSIIAHFYQFGLSQMDPGVNRQHQRAISSDLIYDWEIAVCEIVRVSDSVHSIIYTPLIELTVVDGEHFRASVFMRAFYLTQLFYHISICVLPCHTQTHTHNCTHKIFPAGLTPSSVWQRSLWL